MNFQFHYYFNNSILLWKISEMCDENWIDMKYYKLVLYHNHLYTK